MKSRIKAHVKVKAGDLIPHELNPRVHTDEQREALQALFGEIGFARSLLAYETKDANGNPGLKLIDGHLRQSELDPNEVIDVEVLDVTDEEARKLLLSLDPLASLADFDNKALQLLRDQTTSDSNTLTALWSQIEARDQEVKQAIHRKTRAPKEDTPEQFLVLIECSSEQDQVKLLRRLKKEGLKVTAKTS